MIPTELSVHGNKSIANKQFEIYPVETLSIELASREQPNGIENFYSIIWINSGCGQIKIDLNNFSIEDDTIYYVKPGQAFMCNIQDGAKGFIIRFTRDFFELYEKKSPALINSALFNPSLLMPVIKLNLEAITFMSNLVGEMLSEFKNYLKLKAEILQGYLRIFIIYLSRQFESRNEIITRSRKEELTKIFLEQLEKNFTSKKQVREYASMQSVSPNYLNDSVKEISGFTASYHIQKRVVLEAKRRAIYEGFNLKETAYCLGFPDPAHFSKYFKNGSGVNFTEFRKDYSGF